MGPSMGEAGEGAAPPGGRERSGPASALPHECGAERRHPTIREPAPVLMSFSSVLHGRGSRWRGRARHMLLSACETILGSHLHAIDGNIGCVRDLYVDDRSWEVEYVVIETRPWFPGRRVLVPAAALGRVNGRRRRV